MLAVSLFAAGTSLSLLSARASSASDAISAGTLSSPSSLTTLHPSVTGTGDGNVQLTWTDSLTRAVTFDVQRAPASAPTSWATINGGGNGQSSSSLCTGSVPGAVSCAYIDDSADSTSAPAYNSQYVYQVLADLGGWSEMSAGEMALSVPPASGTDTYLTAPDLLAVSAASATSIWAVGANCTVDYYNGTAWSPQAVPSSVCPTGTSLNGVAASSGSPMIVGSEGVSFACTASCSASAPSWSSKPTGTTNSLSSVSAQSATNMWAVGANCTILYYNGTSWISQDPAPTLCPAGTSLNGVTANAGGPAAQPYVVGNGGLLLLCAGPGCSTSTPSWTMIASGTASDLLAVSTGANNYVVAVGAAGAITTCTGGCNGGKATWTTMTSGTTDALGAVFGQSSTAFFAVGAGGTALACTSNCNQNTGGWAAASSGTTDVLDGVTATSATAAWAVGDAGTIQASSGSPWASESSNIAPSDPVAYTLGSSDLTNLSMPDGVLYSEKGAWPSAGLGTSCTAGSTPGLLLSASPTLPLGYSTISRAVATVVYQANSTPGTGAAFQLLVSSNGGSTWTPYSLSSPGTGGSPATTSVTITNTIGTVSALQNMRLCFEGTSGSGPALTTSVDLVHVDVN